MFSVSTVTRYRGQANSLTATKEIISLLYAPPTPFSWSCDQVHEVLLCGRFCPVVKVVREENKRKSGWSSPFLSSFHMMFLKHHLLGIKVFQREKEKKRNHTIHYHELTVLSHAPRISGWHLEPMMCVKLAIFILFHTLKPPNFFTTNI